MRRRWLFGIKVLVSVSLLAWVLHAALARDGVDALGARIAQVDWTWVLAAVALQLSVIAAGVARWRVLLEAQGIRLPASWLLRSYLVGRFVGAFTPSTAGLDVYRAIAVARHTGRRADAASVILVEKCVGLLGLAAAIGVAVPLGGERFFGDAALFGTGLVALGSAAGLFLLTRPRYLAAVAGVLPGRLGARARAVVAALRARALTPRRIAGTVALSVAGHALTASVFVATAAALGVSASAATVVVVGLAIIAATLLPLSVGGIGVREGVAVALLATVGVDAADATLVALLGYLTGQVPALIGGVLTLDPTLPSPPATATAKPADV